MSGTRQSEAYGALWDAAVRRLVKANLVIIVVGTVLVVSLVFTSLSVAEITITGAGGAVIAGVIVAIHVLHPIYRINRSGQDVENNV
jgi:hypothetical protein